MTKCRSILALLVLGAAPACGDDDFPFAYWPVDVGLDSDTPLGDAAVQPDSDAALDTAPDTPDTPISVDSDEDGVVDEADPAPSDPVQCGDSDSDGCDDCTVRAEFAPDDDGFDTDGDGNCELPLDPACMHGEFAAEDPMRREACELHALVNADRAFWTEEGGDAGPLSWDEGIWVAALGHSRDMCERDYFEHDNPEGLGAGARMDDVGVRWSGWGENISLFPTPLTIEYSFMAEPTCTGHRANILAPGFDRAASALYRCDNPASGWFGEPYTTQNFVSDGDLTESRYCRDPRTSCEDVPDPVSVAREWCRDEGSRCRDVEGPELWDCPED